VNATFDLAAVRLYVVTDARPRLPLERFLDAAIAGGVGMVQLRDKTLPDDELLAVATACALSCRPRGVGFIVNDRPDIALAAGADGVHLGQDDMSVAEARKLLGPDFIIGLSTHTTAQIDAALLADVAYIGVGPIHETPTKPGRTPVGSELVRYAARHAGKPFFAIGGLEPANIVELMEAGARGVSVHRYVTQSPDPQRAAREILEAMERPSLVLGRG
jgi:thiamine-phosphate pyrophosphorylase